MTFLFCHFRHLAKQHLLSKGMPMPQQRPEEVPSLREIMGPGTWDWKEDTHGAPVAGALVLARKLSVGRGCPCRDGRDRVAMRCHGQRRKMRVDVNVPRNSRDGPLPTIIKIMNSFLGIKI